MRKFITLGLFLVLNTAVVFASSIITVKEDSIYKNFISTVVPEDYVEPFYENTKNNITIGIELLAIGQKETEWKMNADGTWPVCRNRNKEGKVVSTDHGPLQLNSKNFESFEEKFGEGLEEYRSDVDIYRMCLCIKYFQDIRSRSGTYNAFREYNGGYRYHNKPVTAAYADKASIYNNQFSREYYTYKRTEMARIEQEEIKKLLSKNGFAFLLKSVERREISKIPVRGFDEKFYVKREDPCRFLKKYGSVEEFYRQRQEKCKKIWKEKYGVENPSLAESVKKKKKESLVSHYGSEEAAQCAIANGVEII